VQALIACAKEEVSGGNDGEGEGEWGSGGESGVLLVPPYVQSEVYDEQSDEESDEDSDEDSDDRKSARQYLSDDGESVLGGEGDMKETSKEIELVVYAADILL
jgi:hypothetical protein